MSFSPILSYPSQIVPGTTFTVRRMGFARRAELDRDTLQIRQRMRELEIENPPDTPEETELREALDIAKKKAEAVSPDQVSGVIENDLKPIVKRLLAAAPTDVQAKRAVLHEEYQLLEAQLRQAWVRAGFVALASGELDGMTVDQLLDYGPQRLVLEIYEAIASDGRLSGAERKNSSSPSITGAAEERATTNTAAPSAAPPEATGSATAST